MRRLVSGPRSLERLIAGAILDPEIVSLPVESRLMETDGF
jgi:hypothetical protein